MNLQTWQLSSLIENMIFKCLAPQTHHLTLQCTVSGCLGRHNINTGMFLASLSLAELLLLVVYIPLEVPPSTFPISHLSFFP